jgi:hypothetical protein
MRYMRSLRFLFFTVGTILGSMATSACNDGPVLTRSTDMSSEDILDLSEPTLLDQLDMNPTPSTIETACAELLIGNRRNQAAENGFVMQLAILGRDAYNFDPAEPRYIDELLENTLNPASPFGGNFWELPYTNIRLGHAVLHALDKVADTELAPPEKAAIRGFTHTTMALDLLEVIVTHDSNGAVIDTDPSPSQGPGAIADNSAVYSEIARLLDSAVLELDAAPSSFPFEFPEGYKSASPNTSFNTPTMYRKFNRAIRARTAAYMKDYPAVLAALAESFLDDSSARIDFDIGVYHSYTPDSGGVENELGNLNIFAHPSLAAGVESNGGVRDERFTRKIEMASTPGSSQGLTSNFQFTIYSGPTAPVPLIRNEELVLLKSEALFYTNQVSKAYDELNIVRVQSGGLPSLLAISDETSFVDYLLYERRYSLLFEWGHRWIDLRRFGRLQPPLLDKPEHLLNVRYPIPLSECSARTNEPRCALGST